MRGTANTRADHVGGSALAAPLIVDETTILTSADDDAIFELLDLEPPAAASPTNVNVGFVPQRSGPAVVGDAAALQITVRPIRVARSSTDNAKPRDLVSGALLASATVLLPALPAAGRWRADLVYAQVAYTNPRLPPPGATVTIFVPVVHS